jgi:hypothetical protein
MASFARIATVSTAITQQGESSSQTLARLGVSLGKTIVM